MRTDRLATLLAAALFAVVLAVLAVTGAWLAFGYQPGVHPLARQAHRVAAVLALPTGAAVPVTALARKRPRMAAAAAFLAAVPVAFFTGLMLPWDAVDLDKAGAGVVFEGLSPAFRGDVQDVEVDNRTMGLGTYRVHVATHLVVFPAVFLGAGRFLLRR